MYDNDYIKCPSCGGEVISTLKKCIYCQKILDTELNQDLSSLKYETISLYSGTYAGELLDGKPYGQGTLSLPNGTEYSGAWIDGKPNGNGKVNYSNDEIYEGSFKSGIRDGLGKYIFSDGRQLEGEWENGKFIRPIMKNSVYEEEETIFNSYAPKRKEEQLEHSLFNFKYKRNFIQAIGFYLFFIALRFVVAGLLGFITGSPTTLDYSNYEPWMVVEDLLSATYTIVIYFTVYKQKNLQSVFLIILGLLSGAIAWGFGVLYSFIPIAYLTTLKVNE